MILETVEQRCLNYLKQIKDPLAPVHAVLHYVREDEQCADTTEHELIEFLRKHELFRVIEPDPPQTARVILVTRIPSKAVMGALLNEQWSNMTDALDKALREVEACGDDATRARVAEMIERARSIQGKMKDLL